MTYVEVLELLVPALQGLGRASTVDQAKLLDQETGVDYYHQYTTLRTMQHVPLPEDYANLLRQLAGPHAHTILKAYRIKKGLE